MNLPSAPPEQTLGQPMASEPWKSPDWERLWLATQSRSWTTLALVPAGVGGPPDFTLSIAMALARTGMVHLGAQVHVADATTLSLGSNAQFLAQVRATTQSGPVLIALAPPSESSVTVPLARDANAAILCVSLGKMRVSDAKKTIREVGKQKFIGSASFR
jgi:hypothetical protein